MDNKTCILYFGRSAREELKSKQLTKSKSASLQLIKKLQKLTISKIKNSGLPFVIHHENLQVGYSFGERLTNAISMCFQNYENVVVVGYDCPLLTKLDLIAAKESLVDGINVVGADENGGAYLIGLTRDCWNPECFQQLAWKSNSLCSDLISVYFKNVSLRISQSKIDVNSTQDLFSLVATSHLKGYILALLNLAQVAIVRSTNRTIISSRGVFPDLQFRGPPIL